MSLAHFTHADGRPIRSSDLRLCDACDVYIGIQIDFVDGSARAFT